MHGARLRCPPPFSEIITMAILHPLSFARGLCRLPRLVLNASILLLASLAAQAASAADAFPNRSIRMIVPFSAGGPADIVGRLYAQHLSDLMGQPVVVLNRDGAGGIIGTNEAARAAADGYTIVFGTTSTMVINQIISKKLPYDFFRDFSLVGLIANAPHVLAVRADFPARTVPELIALAKQHPGKYTFATSGIGTIVQMGGELLKYTADINLMHVPYKGGGPATLAMLGGEVDMTVNDLTTIKNHIASGKLRALAVADKNRLALLPDVATFTELGLPRMVSSTWWGIALPQATPADIQARFQAANSKIVANPDYAARLAELAVQPLVLTDQESRDFIAAETQKWQTIANVADISVD
ncbi:periplasmic solute-binding protein [Mycobacteroides abscessus subsp. abscessus]|nr:periplasmic solute-binding protein [Mycobacteroides abscessus subsp. abscessus]